MCGVLLISFELIYFMIDLILRFSYLIEPLCNLFRGWPDNDLLPLIQLRKKTLTLCMFIEMMRPNEPALMEKSKIHFTEDLEWMDVYYLKFKTDD
jgi:hypothetical protein